MILAPALTLPTGIAMLAAIVLLAGCATTHPLMPTPTAYVGKQAKPLFVDLPADSQKPPLDLLYVTDRAPATEADKTPSLQRRALAFDGVRRSHDRVRQRRLLGHVGCGKHREQALGAA